MANLVGRPVTVESTPATRGRTYGHIRRLVEQMEATAHQAEAASRRCARELMLMVGEPGPNVTPPNEEWQTRALMIEAQWVSSVMAAGLRQIGQTSKSAEMRGMMGRAMLPVRPEDMVE